LRVVFMGSPAVAVPSLEALIHNNYPVVAAYTQPDRPAGRGRAMVSPPVKAVAQGRGIPVLQPDSLKSPESVTKLAHYKPDVIVVCAFGQILTQAILDVPPYQCLNVHFSLLPRHRGASPVMAAILAGDEYTGVTIQLMRKKLDTGPVLTRAAVPISAIDTTGSLMDKLSIVGAHLLLEALNGWLRHEAVPKVQDEDGATYFSQVTKEAGSIDWTMPAVEIWRRVRAFSPWPGSYTTWRGRQLKVTEAVPMTVEDSPGPGRVIVPAGRDIPAAVGTGDGVLGLVRVQLEGKKAMSTGDFLQGHRDFIGTVLPG